MYSEVTLFCGVSSYLRISLEFQQDQYIRAEWGSVCRILFPAGLLLLAGCYRRNAGSGKPPLSCYV